MTGSTCPHCKKSTISLKKRYLATKWCSIYCDACSGRICTHPIVLAVLSFLYVWDVLLFGTLFFQTHDWVYIAALTVIWLILDYFSMYIPLAPMKPPENSKTPQKKTAAPEVKEN